MKSLIILSLVLMSGFAEARTADVAGTIAAFQAAGKLSCTEATSAIADANIKAGMNILLLVVTAEEAEKAGDATKKKEAMDSLEKISATSQAISTLFNEKCVKADAVFIEE